MAAARDPAGNTDGVGDKDAADKKDPVDAGDKNKPQKEATTKGSTPPATGD